jgi:acetyltransferase-like isoleucine patch superfamily enzyme
VIRAGRWLGHDWLARPLPDNVELGEGCWLYSSFAFLHCRSTRPVAVRIGDHSGIYEGTFFDLGPCGRVEIGSYCSIVGAIFATDGTVEIGDYTFVAHEVVFADDSFAGPPGAGPNKPAKLRPEASIGRDVWVGLGAIILGAVTIGDGAVVAARAVVREDVPPDSIVAGDPARVVRWLTDRSRGRVHDAYETGR